MEYSNRKMPRLFQKARSLKKTSAIYIKENEKKEYVSL